MNKGKVLKITGIAVGSTATIVTAVGGAVGIGLGSTIINKAKANSEKVIRNNHNTLINSNSLNPLDGGNSPLLLKGNEKLKYVALGDSIAAGYSMGDMSDHRGHLNPATRDITGVSYGSYIARAFENKNKLGAFNNYAIGGFTSGNLLNLLNGKFIENENDKEHRKTSVSDSQSSPLTKAKYEQFKTELPAKLEAANFVSISVGANDILGGLKIGGVSINELFKVMATGDFDSIMGKLSADAFIDFDQDFITKQIAYVKSNIQKIIMEIKRVNPNVKIALVGYPMPLIWFRNLLHKISGEKGKPNSAKSEILLDTLNSIPKDISRKFDTVDYIDVDRKKLWTNNGKELSKVAMDIHPTTLGYRVMAAEILAKITGNVGLSPSGNENKTDDFEEVYVGGSKTEQNTFKTRINDTTLDLTNEIKSLYNLHTLPTDVASPTVVPFGADAVRLSNFVSNHPLGGIETKIINMLKQSPAAGLVKKIDFSKLLGIMGPMIKPLIENLKISEMAEMVEKLQSTIRRIAPLAIKKLVGSMKPSKGGIDNNKLVELLKKPLENIIYPMAPGIKDIIQTLFKTFNTQLGEEFTQNQKNINFIINAILPPLLAPLGEAMKTLLPKILTEDMFKFTEEEKKPANKPTALLEKQKGLVKTLSRMMPILLGTLLTGISNEISEDGFKHFRKIFTDEHSVMARARVAAAAISRMLLGKSGEQIAADKFGKENVIDSKGKTTKQFINEVTWDKLYGEFNLAKIVADMKLKHPNKWLAKIYPILMMQDLSNISLDEIIDNFAMAQINWIFDFASKNMKTANGVQKTLAEVLQ